MSSSSPSGAIEGDPSRNGAASGSRSQNNDAMPATTSLEMIDLDPSARKNNGSTIPTITTGDVAGSSREQAPVADQQAERQVEALSIPTDQSIESRSAAGGGLHLNIPGSSAPPTSTEAATGASSVPLGSNEGDTASAAQAKPGPMPTVMLTLLLTTGQRHSYRIDDRYLKKRNIHSPNNDPFDISVYTLKELILREWRTEWDAKPSSPSSIRLIHFGRLLDDKAPLRECRLNADSPNVIHMTVRPQEMVDEEDAKTSKQALGRDRHGGERSPGCRCVIL